MTDGDPQNMDASLRRYRELFELAPNGYLTTDRDGRVVEANRAAGKLFGRPRRSLAGTPLETFVPEDERPRFRARLEALCGGRAERIQDWHLPLAPDHAPPFDAEVTVAPVVEGDAGTVSSLVWLVRDVTERKRAEEQVRDSERSLQHARGELQQSLARTQAILDSAVDGIITIDRHGSVESMNPSAEAMFGYSAGEVVGRNVRMLMPSPYREEHDGYLHRYLETGEKRIIGIGREVVGRRKDGSTFPLDLAVAEFVHGERPAFVGTLRDVTQRKEIEEALRQAQKMEAVGRLAGGIAHDFNTLLGSIIGFSEMLLDGLDEGHPLRRAAEQIHRGAERGAALTRQLLVFSRRQVLRPQVVRLRSVVDDMSPMLRRLIGEDVELVHRGDDVEGAVRVDGSQLEQVILNLVVNARDALPRGGRVVIETREVVVDDASDVDVPGPGRYLVLAVSDDGCGMDETTRRRIFEPFFTTKEQGKGTGLGLSMVYGVVKQSGGGIRVESAVGQGSTLQIFLPRVEDDEVGNEPPPAPEAETTPGCETVLLVEDDAMFRELLEEVLEGKGYRVLSAAEPRAALEIVERHTEPLDLVVSDMVMPGMTGTELVDRVRGRHPAIKVVLMSGYTDEDLATRGASGGDELFLQKPFSTKVFLRVVRDALA